MRSLIVAALLLLALVLGFFAALGQGTLAIIATFVAIGAVLIFVQPRLAVMVVLFGLYINAPVVAVRDHGLPSIFGVAFPLLLIVPVTTYILLRRGKLIFDVTFAWMIGFLAVQTLSTLFAFDIGVATDALVNYAVEGLMLYFLLVNVIRDESDLRLAIWAVTIAAAIMGGIVLFQEVTKTFTDTYGGFAMRMASFETDTGGDWRDRTAGPIGDPNFFAQVLLMVVPLALFRFWGERKLGLRLLAVGCTLLIIAGVVLTFSRGAAIALIVSLGVIAYLWRIKPYQLVLGIVGIAFFVTIIAPDFLGRVQSVSDVGGLVNQDTVTRDKSILGRATENLAAIYMFLDHPLVGVGPENYPKLYTTYAEQTGYYVRFRERPAHNLYLSTAAELGIVGLAVFLTLMAVQIGRLLKIRQYRAKFPEAANYATAAAISLVAYLMTSMFLHLAYQRYIWMIMALASVAANLGAAKIAELKQPHQSLVEVTTSTSMVKQPGAPRV
jgi:O-antigen ligase